MKIPEDDNLDKLHTGVKAALNLIPFVGGTATELFNSIITPPIEKRKKQWMELVAINLNKLEEKQSGIVQQLSESEEFASLLITASINAVKTHLKDKHKKLMNALINSSKPNLSFDIKEVYINFIDELTLPHLEVLKFVNDYEARITSVNEFRKLYNILIEGTIDPKVPRMAKMEVTSFRFLLKDLEAKGLVFISQDMKDLEDQVYESSFLIGEEGKEKDLPFIRITTFGKEFLNFIGIDE